MTVRLIRADLIKLSGRRWLMLFAMVGGSAVLAAYCAILLSGGHSLGGRNRWFDILGPLAMLAVVEGIIIGATAGAQDAEAGTDRDLIATGTPRVALYGSRLAAALAVTLSPLLIALAGAMAVTIIGDGGTPGPTAGDIAAGVAEVLAAGVVGCAACVGLAGALRSRGPVVGLALAFQLGLSPLLGEMPTLGDARVLIPQVAIARIPGPAGLGLTCPLWVAVASLVVWVVVLLAAGARRFARHEL